MLANIAYSEMRVWVPDTKQHKFYTEKDLLANLSSWVHNILAKVVKRLARVKICSSPAMKALSR